ncbi:MAG: VapE domain-containing protein, partial [Paraclostridium sp.]
LIIYENGDFAYSHHSTDPCSGRLCNSFDLVGIHLFKDAINDMLEFCSKDKKVVGEFGRFKVQQAQSDFGTTEENIDITNIENINEAYDDTWMESLEVDKKGYYKPSVKNIVLILENDINLKNKIKFDEFSETIMKCNKINKKDGNIHTVWDDYDDSNLRYYLEKNYGIYAPVKTDDAISTVAKNKAFHPIRDYINSTTWDQVNRIDTLLVDYLGSEDSEYARAVIRKAMVAAIARVFEPGIKFDYMPVLVGPQGVGKSHILSLIGKSWYSDSFNTVLGKEAYEQLQGCWIIEMAELSAIRKAEAEAVKHFISKREDVYRAAYGRRVTKHKRQCIFFGTTNDIEFLKDKTGNRRYWPIVVAKQKPTKNMFKQLNKEEINQLWAEAKYLYDNHEPLVMDEKLSREAIKKQEQHMEGNIKEGMIIEYLDMLLPKEWKVMDIGARRRYINGSDFADIKGTEKRERVCAMEIWCELFGGDARNMNPMQSREINDILRKLKGWEMYPRSNGKLRFGVYGLQKAFVKEEN